MIVFSWTTWKSTLDCWHMMKHQSSECSFSFNTFGSCIVMSIKNKSNICGCTLKGKFVGEETGWITAHSTVSRVYLFVHPCEKLTLGFCSVLLHPLITYINSQLLAEVIIYLLSFAKQNSKRFKIQRDVRVSWQYLVILNKEYFTIICILKGATNNCAAIVPIPTLHEWNFFISHSAFHNIHGFL